MKSVFYRATAYFPKEPDGPRESCGHKHRSFDAAHRCGVATFASAQRLFDVFARKYGPTSYWEKVSK